MRVKIENVPNLDSILRCSFLYNQISFVLKFSWLNKQCYNAADDDNDDNEDPNNHLSLLLCLFFVLSKNNSQNMRTASTPTSITSCSSSWVRFLS